MPIFNKEKGFAAMFVAKTPFAKRELGYEGEYEPQTKTRKDISTDIDPATRKKDKDWSPMFEGANFSKEEWDSMSLKEKKATGVWEPGM